MDAFTYEKETTRRIPDDVAMLLANLIGTARTLTEENGEARPMAFIINAAEKMLVPVPLRFNDEADKDASARLVRLAALGLKADCVVFLAESWGIEGNKTTVEAVKENGGRVVGLPGAYACIMLNVETYDGQWIAMPKLTHKGKKKSFGPPEFKFMKGGEGRFMGLLPPRGKGH